MTTFPDTVAMPLSRPISDHLPCVIKIGNAIPKAKVFRFENYWLKHSNFKDVVTAAWNIPVGKLDAAKSITAKFKNLRRTMKQWARNISFLKTKNAAIDEVIFQLDLFEEFRYLADFERKCRQILKEHLIILLKNQKIYC